MTVVYCTAAQVSAALGLGWSGQQTVGSNTLNTTIFAPTTAGQIYSIGDSLLLSNDDGVTETSTVSAISYGASYTSLTVGSLTNEALFTTANNTTVEIKSYFNALSLPRKSEVDEWIEESQDEIDYFCHRSWMGAGSGTGQSWKGYLRWRPTYPIVLSDIYEYYKVKLPYPDPVLPLASSEGDSLKVWNGGKETEYVDVYTEGRTDAFWLDDKGFLMINKERPWPGNRAVYINYRYGKDFVPGDIKRCCVELTGNKFLQSNIYNNQPMTEGQTSETWPYSNARGFSEAKVFKRLKRHRRLIHL